MTTVTSHMLAIGDDGRLHWWRFRGSEELTRACDGVVAVNVEMYARDRHGAAKMCGACERKREAL